MRRRLLVPASVGAVLLVLLAGCSGGDEPAAKPTPTASPTAEGLPEGTPVPELLSGVRCVAEDDVWVARGSFTNPTKNPVSYQLTAQVGPAGDASPARTQRYDDVAAGEKITFELAEVPTSSPDGPCHVQLLALADD